MTETGKKEEPPERGEEGGTAGLAATTLAKGISLTRSGIKTKNALISQSPSIPVPGRYERCARKYVSSRASISHPRSVSFHQPHSSALISGSIETVVFVGVQS